ncbi:MAG: hypothetical protein ACOYNI_01945 [Acidimicrobiia bacterium]
MCFIVLIGAFAPRLALFFLWIFSDRLAIAFSNFWIGLAGFVFLPFTALLYAIAYAPARGVQGFGWFLVTFGFLLDLAHWFGGASETRNRSAH